MAASDRWSLPCSHRYSSQNSSLEAEITAKITCIVCGKEYDSWSTENLPSWDIQDIRSYSTCESLTSIQADYHCSQTINNSCSDNLESLGNLPVEVLPTVLQEKRTVLCEHQLSEEPQLAVNHESLSSIQADYLCSHSINYLCSDNLETLGNLPVEILPIISQEKKTIFCELHPSEEPRLACSLCYVAICDECITESECPAAFDKKHSILRLNKLSDRLKVPLEKLSSVFQKHSISISELIKKAQKILEERKLKCEDMKAQVEKSRQEQIAEINEKTEKLKDQIDAWYRRSQGLAEDYSSYLLSIKDNQDHMSGQLLKLVHQALDVEVINEYTPLLKKSKTLLDWKSDALALPALELTPGDKRRELEIDVCSTENVIVIAAQDNSSNGGSSSIMGVVVEHKFVNPGETQAHSQSSKGVQQNSSTCNMSPPENDSQSNQQFQPNTDTSSVVSTGNDSQSNQQFQPNTDTSSVVSSGNDGQSNQQFQLNTDTSSVVSSGNDGQSNQQFHPNTDNSSVVPSGNDSSDSYEDPRERVSSLLTHLLQLKDVLEVVRERKSIHENISCDSCHKKNIKGIRYKCCVCTNYDLCNDCFGLPREIIHDPRHIFMKLNRPMKTKEAEEIVTKIRKDAIAYRKNMDFKRNAHLSMLKCMKCNTAPIRGTRFRCLVCNGDMCSSCEAEAKNFHDEGHPVIILSHPSRK